MSSLQIQADTGLELTSTGSVLWRLPLEPRLGLPARLQANGHSLTRKAEMHITVLGRELAASHLRSVDVRDRWFRAWICLHQRIRIADELWLLRKREGDAIDHSLVTACDAPALHAARRLLGEWMGVPLQPAIAHITLYCGTDPRGIAVATEQQLMERRIASGPWAAFGLTLPAGM